MSEKVKERISWSIAGFIVLIVIFISIITYLYPYSSFSVNKSYSYQPEKVLFNGENYGEILIEFKDSYEKDLKADSDSENSNLTIDRTRYILPIFEQDWLISDKSVSFDKVKFDIIHSEVQKTREVLLNLVVQVDYTSEQRRYLVDIIRNLLSLEDNISELKDENYLSRSELNNRLDNIYSEFTNNFRFFVTFYDRSTNE
ncbi:hypothetical protein [Paraliobacillus sp. X-1268]|uniref:hypothetical protein n=1 Tax=Paraliobacillus sp. X-1268 TaxID=2213193 RepID=UPI000E3CDA3A|nr:hypothetical protein [Paraliobacillus sp. X-1268]